MKDLPGSAPGKPVLPSLWTENLTIAFLNHLPDRYHVGRRRARSKSKATHPGAEDVTTLRTSFNISDGLRDLQKRKWKPSDLQYVFLAGLTLFSLWIAPPAPALKFFALLAASWILLMPATRQFFMPSVTIWVWLVYFFCSRYVLPPASAAALTATFCFCVPHCPLPRRPGDEPRSNMICYTVLFPTSTDPISGSVFCLPLRTFYTAPTCPTFFLRTNTPSSTFLLGCHTASFTLERLPCAPCSCSSLLPRARHQSSLARLAG